MSTTIDAIRGLLNLPRLQKFYAEARLDDGRVVVTEAESMEVGAEVRVMGEDGSAQELESGSYTLEDGTALVIEDNRIARLGEGEETEAAETEDKEEEMSKNDEMATVLESVGLSEEDKEKVMASIKALYEQEEEEMSEETPEVTPEPEVEQQEELSALTEFASEVTGALEHILTRIENLEQAPAGEPVKFSAPAQNTNLTHPGINANYTDRARYIMQSLKQN